MDHPRNYKVSKLSTISRHSMGYEEFDALNSSVDGRTTLTGLEKEPFRIDKLSAGGMSLSIAAAGGANVYEGEARNSRVSLVIGMPSQNPLHVNSVLLDSEHMILFRPGDLVTSYSRDVCRYALMSFPFDQFVNMVDLADSSQTKDILSGPCGRGISKENWQKTVARVCRAHDRMNDINFLHNRNLQRAAMAEIAQSFVDTLVEGGAETQLTGRPKTSRKEIISRAIETLHSPSYFKYSIKEMARCTGVTERTFRTVCHERLGISPKRYIMLRQMHDIRQALEQASRNDRVSRISSKFGVWDWGRFSLRYRELYGEKPSQTLSREARASI